MLADIITDTNIIITATILYSVRQGENELSCSQLNRRGSADLGVNTSNLTQV